MNGVPENILHENFANYVKYSSIYRELKQFEKDSIKTGIFNSAQDQLCYKLPKIILKQCTKTEMANIELEDNVTSENEAQIKQLSLQASNNTDTPFAKQILPSITLLNFSKKFNKRLTLLEMNERQSLELLETNFNFYVNSHSRTYGKASWYKQQKIKQKILKKAKSQLFFKYPIVSITHRVENNEEILLKDLKKCYSVLKEKNNKIIETTPKLDNTTKIVHVDIVGLNQHYELNLSEESESEENTTKDINIQNKTPIMLSSTDVPLKKNTTQKDKEVASSNVASTNEGVTTLHVPSNEIEIEPCSEYLQIYKKFILNKIANINKNVIDSSLDSSTDDHRDNEIANIDKNVIGSSTDEHHDNEIANINKNIINSSTDDHHNNEIANINKNVIDSSTDDQHNNEIANINKNGNGSSNDDHRSNEDANITSQSANIEIRSPSTYSVSNHEDATSESCSLRRTERSRQSPLYNESLSHIKFYGFNGKRKSPTKVNSTTKSPAKITSPLPYTSQPQPSCSSEVRNELNDFNNIVLPSNIISVKFGSKNCKGTKINIKLPVSLDNIAGNYPLDIEFDLSKLDISQCVMQRNQNNSKQNEDNELSAAIASISNDCRTTTKLIDPLPRQPTKRGRKPNQKSAAPKPTKPNPRKKTVKNTQLDLRDYYETFNTIIGNHSQQNNVTQLNSTSNGVQISIPSQSPGITTTNEIELNNQDIPLGSILTANENGELVYSISGNNIDYVFNTGETEIENQAMELVSFVENDNINTTFSKDISSTSNILSRTVDNPPAPVVKNFYELANNNNNNYYYKARPFLEKNININNPICEAHLSTRWKIENVDNSFAENIIDLSKPVKPKPLTINQYKSRKRTFHDHDYITMKGPAPDMPLLDELMNNQLSSTSAIPITKETTITIDNTNIDKINVTNNSVDKSQSVLAKIQKHNENSNSKKFKYDSMVSVTINTANGSDKIKRNCQLQEEKVHTECDKDIQKSNIVMKIGNNICMELDNRIDIEKENSNISSNQNNPIITESESIQIIDDFLAEKTHDDVDFGTLDDTLELCCSPILDDIDIPDPIQLTNITPTKKLSDKDDIFFEDYTNQDIFGIPKKKQINQTNDKIFKIPKLTNPLGKQCNMIRNSLFEEDDDQRPIRPCWPNNPTNIARPPPNYLINSPSASNNLDNNQSYDLNQIAQVFGKPCLSFLDKKCIDSRCNLSHKLLEAKDVKERVLIFGDQHVISAYKYIKKHTKLYQNYFIIFCEIFTEKLQINMLIQMIKDTKIYPECIDYFRPLIKFLIKAGKNKNEAIQIIFNNIEDIPHKNDVFINLITDFDYVFLHLNTLREYISFNYTFPVQIANKLATCYLKNPNDELSKLLFDIIVNITKISAKLLADEKSEDLVSFLEQFKSMGQSPSSSGIQYQQPHTFSSESIPILQESLRQQNLTELQPMRQSIIRTINCNI